MSWADSIFKFAGRLAYTSLEPTVQNGQSTEMRCDANGRLLVSAAPINTSWVDGGPVVAEKVIKASAGRLHQIFGRNTGATAKHIFIFNHSTGGGSRPANGSTAALFVPIKVEAGGAFSIDLPQSRAFSTGLYWGVSSTDATFTYDSTGTFLVSAEYE